MTEPCHLSAVDARRLIGQKKLSPVELMQSCLKRIEAVNPSVNAVISLDEKLAMDGAKAAEKLLMNGGHLDVLHGLPVGIKDLNPVEGLRSTWGSLIFKDHIPEVDDPIVSSVRIAGGIPFCKTNVPEFGAGGNTTNKVFGPTCNPFDATLTSAGSSGGTAAALALNMMPLASGSDYGGSCRTPAAFCGITGMRTSPGLIPSPDKTAGLIPWGVQGPMARDVADAYLFLRALVTVDRADPFSSMDGLEWPEVLLPADLAGLRMAFTSDFGQAPVDRMIKSVFLERMKSASKAFLDSSDATPDFSGVHEIFEVHRGRNVIDKTERGLKLTASEIGRGFVEQMSLMKRVHNFFNDFDVLIAPAASVSPFPHSQLFIEEINGHRLDTYMHWLAISYAPTMALCCAIAIPCGRDENGLPFGIQLIAPRGHDRRLMEIALALEQVLAGSLETARPVPDAIIGASRPAAKAVKGK
jgi:amidase